MSANSASSSLSGLQKGLLVVTALVLAVVLFLLRNGLSAESPMDQLARRSLAPEVALSNQKPTMLEFYADWCEACREMAPAMLETERRTSGRMDVVLVNIDNPQWQDLIDRYEVNGIPQLNLFAADGSLRGRSLGVRTPQQLEALSTALIANTPLPQFAGIGSVSSLEPGDGIATATPTSAGPRSHG